MESSRLSFTDFFPGFQTPFYFAHRGCSARYPENTLAAFSAAKERGIPAVELDVWLTKDRQLVVSHNESAEKVSGVAVSVPKSTLNELSALNFAATYNQSGSTNCSLPSFHGSPNRGKAPLHEPIPTLESVFAMAGNAFLYDIEIKEKHRRTVLLKEIRRLLTKYHIQRAFVSSFWPLVVRRAGAMGFRPTALIFGEEEGRWKTWVQRAKIRLARPSMLKPRRDLAPILLASPCRLYQKPVCTWTVDSEEEARRLFRLGVAGVCSNHPEDFQLP